MAKSKWYVRGGIIGSIMLAGAIASFFAWDKAVLLACAVAIILTLVFVWRDSNEWQCK